MVIVHEVRKRTGVRIRALQYDDKICLLRKSAFGQPDPLRARITEYWRNNMDVSVFDTKKMDAYAAQAKQQWGHTDAYRDFAEKSKGRSKETEEALAEGMMAIFSDFGRCKDADPGSPEAQALVRRVQAYISENYYPCTPEILNALGAMYGADSAFVENIDKAGGAGTAKFAERAISVYCRSV